MKRSTLEKAFAVAVLILSTGGILPMLFASGQDGTTYFEGNQTIQAIWASLYLVVAILLARRWKNALWLAGKDWVLVALLVLTGISIVWSTVPEVTLRRSIALLGTSLFGVYLAQRYTIDEVIRLVAWALVLAALVSIVVIAVHPSYGIMMERHVGAWRGVFVHKNHLGRYMSLGALVCWMIGTGNRRWLSLVGVAMCTMLVVMSTSRAALMMVLGTAFLIATFKGLRRDIRIAIPFAVATVIVVGSAIAWVASNYAAILTALGRDPTLTGRTTLWGTLVEFISRRPLLGYGYDAFWNGRSSEALYVWRLLGWDVPHAHNGVLDLLLSVGVIGAALFMVSFVRVFGIAMAWARHNRSRAGLWPIVFLAFMLVYNVGESVVLQRNNIFWVLYITLALQLTAWKRRTMRESSRTVQYDLARAGELQSS